MPYITGFEIDGMVKNARESVIEVLETRFRVVPSRLSDCLNSLDNLTLLKQLLKQSITVTSVDRFEQILAQIISEN